MGSVEIQVYVVYVVGVQSWRPGRSVVGDDMLHIDGFRHSVGLVDVSGERIQVFVIAETLPLLGARVVYAAEVFC